MRRFACGANTEDAKRFSSTHEPDPFDLEHHIETSQRVHASDLRIKSRYWMDGTNYDPVPVKLIREAIAALPINARRIYLH